MKSCFLVWGMIADLGIITRVSLTVIEHLEMIRTFFPLLMDFTIFSGVNRCANSQQVDCTSVVLFNTGGNGAVGVG